MLLQDHRTVLTVQVVEYAMDHCLVDEHARVMTEWKPEHFSDVAVLLSKCEDVYSADVPSSLLVNKYAVWPLNWSLCV